MGLWGWIKDEWKDTWEGVYDGADYLWNDAFSDGIGGLLEGAYTQLAHGKSPQHLDWIKTHMQEYLTNVETYKTGLTDQQKEVFDQEIVRIGGNTLPELNDYENTPDHLRGSSFGNDVNNRNAVIRHNKKFKEAWENTIDILDRRAINKSQRDRLGDPKNKETKDKALEAVTAVGGSNVSTAAGRYQKKRDDSLKIQGGLGY